MFENWSIKAQILLENILFSHWGSDHIPFLLPKAATQQYNSVTVTAKYNTLQINI